MPIQWKPGEWTNNIDFRSQNSWSNTPAMRVYSAKDRLLSLLHPDTPIDPEGYVAHWAAPNWKAGAFEYYVNVFYPADRYGVERGVEWLVEVQPLWHLPYPKKGESVDDAVRKLFRIRSSTRLTLHARSRYYYDERTPRWYTGHFRKEIVQRFTR